MLGIFTLCAPITSCRFLLDVAEGRFHSVVSEQTDSPNADNAPPYPSAPSMLYSRLDIHRVKKGRYLQSELFIRHLHRFYSLSFWRVALSTRYWLDLCQGWGKQGQTHQSTI